MHANSLEVTSSFKLRMMKKIRHAKKLKTNIKNLISPLMTRPQGARGVKTFLTIFWWFGAPILSLNWVRFENPQENMEFQWFLFSILMVFSSFFSFGGILAQELNSFLFFNLIFWHPWDPWGCVNSGKKYIWAQTSSVAKIPNNQPNLCKDFCPSS